MNWRQLWAGVRFSAQGGRGETLLQTAAAQGLCLRRVRPTPLGFCAECPARHYLRLAPLARRCRVRLRVQRRRGIYFTVRSAVQRKGLLAGALCFGLVVWRLQSLVWAIDCGSATAGQAARIRQALRSAGVQPGAAVTQPLLTAAEYAVLNIGAPEGEFSWASVNFEKGRITVEFAEAKAVPQIDSEEVSALYAKTDGKILAVEPEDGTPQVVPGQQVYKGQLLIGTSRAERDGSLNYRRAAGRVIAQVEWQGSAQAELAPAVRTLTGERWEWYQLSAAGRTLTLASPQLLQAGLPGEQQALLQVRHFQLEVFGIPLPVSVTATAAFAQQEQTIPQTETLAAAKARLACEQQLYAAFPDAEVYAWSEQTAVSDGVLTLQVTAALRADIAVRLE